MPIRPVLMGHFVYVENEMGRDPGQDCGGKLKMFSDLLACHLHSFLLYRYAAACLDSWISIQHVIYGIAFDRLSAAGL
jgi:hypothetical protein